MIDAAFWGIVGAIAGVIALLSLKDTIQDLIDSFKRRKYNKKICLPLVEARDEFLEENYNINTIEEEKPFGITNTKSDSPQLEECEDFTAFKLPSSYYNSTKNLNLNGLTLIIDWGIKKPIREHLIRKGLSYDDADEISKEETSDFIEKKLSGANGILKRRRSVEIIKTAVKREEAVTARRTFIRRHPEEIRKIIRDTEYTKIKEKYETFVQNSPDYQQSVGNDVTEIIKRIRTKKVIKDELDIRKARTQGFNNNTTDKLKDLKKSFLTNRKTFIKRVGEIDNRSEEIYALILENPGHYELEMSELFTIPQPTISIYCDEMSKNHFVIKDTYSTTGNYVYLYPHFTSEEIIAHSESLSGYDIGIIDKITQENNKIILSTLSNFELNLENINTNLTSYVGFELFFKCRIDKNIITILGFGIVKSKELQESLGRYIKKTTKT